MKSMKNFAAQQLTKKQMNEVKGGSLCPSGQNEYVCTATYSSGAKTSGRLCAASQAEARTEAFFILGEYASMTSLVC